MMNKTKAIKTLVIILAIVVFPLAVVAFIAGVL